MHVPAAKEKDEAYYRRSEKAKEGHTSCAFSRSNFPSDRIRHLLVHEGFGVFIRLLLPPTTKFIYILYIYCIYILMRTYMNIVHIYMRFLALVSFVGLTWFRSKAKTKHWAMWDTLCVPVSINFCLSLVFKYILNLWTLTFFTKLSSTIYSKTQWFERS